MHILLVDDDADDRLLVSRLIRRDHPNAEIFSVASEQELTCHLARDHIDLAIIDYSLGWSDGLKVFRLLKAAHPDSGAIMYSGVGGEDYAVEAIKAGLDDYIVKDVARQPRLRTSIHALLAQGQQRHQLRLSQQRYAELFQRVTVGLFECTADGRFEDANPALLSMLGVATLADLSERRFFDVFKGADLARPLSALPENGIGDLRVSVCRDDGREFVGLLNAYPSRGGEGHVQGVLANVTALQKALDEKGVLLREVYHRVYNNLQLVISLLGMQARRFPEEDVRGGFREVMDRVRSLSLVQQKLHRTEEYSAVDFEAYLRDLAHSLMPPEKTPNISILFDLVPLFLPIDKAIPLGLIANELLMNAMKHAFPGERKGVIRVRLSRRSEGRVLLAISDTGIGLRDEAVVSQGVGARLIRQLVRQAEATLRLKTSAGLTVEVEFPHDAV